MPDTSLPPVEGNQGGSRGPEPARDDDRDPIASRIGDLAAGIAPLRPQDVPGRSDLRPDPSPEHKHNRWLVAYQQSEIKILEARVEGLQRRLRRGIIWLMAAAVYGVLISVVAIRTTVVLLREPPQADGTPASAVVGAPTLRARVDPAPAQPGADATGAGTKPPVPMPPARAALPSLALQANLPQVVEEPGPPQALKVPSVERSSLAALPSRAEGLTEPSTARPRVPRQSVPTPSAEIDLRPRASAYIPSTAGLSQVHPTGKSPPSGTTTSGPDNATGTAPEMPAAGPIRDKPPAAGGFAERNTPSAEGGHPQLAGRSTPEPALSPLRAALMATRRLTEEARRTSVSGPNTGERVAAEDAMSGVLTATEPPTETGNRITSPSTSGIPPAERRSPDGNVAAAREKQRVGETAYHLVASDVSLRADPSDTAIVIAVIERGRVLREINRSGGWVRVEAADGSSRSSAGWVSDRLLRAQEAGP